MKNQTLEPHRTSGRRVFSGRRLAAVAAVIAVAVASIGSVRLAGGDGRSARRIASCSLASERDSSRSAGCVHRA